MHIVSTYSRHRERLQVVRRRKMEQFADLIAAGHNQTAAARAVGVSQQAGNSYFKQIRMELGRQAYEAGCLAIRCDDPDCPCQKIPTGA